MINKAFVRAPELPVSKIMQSNEKTTIGLKRGSFLPSQDVINMKRSAKFVNHVRESLRSGIKIMLFRMSYDYPILQRVALQNQNIRLERISRAGLELSVPQRGRQWEGGGICRKFCYPVNLFVT